MPTNVNMDMSHEAELASMPIFAMMSPMTTGTLNWIVAIAVPNRSMTTAISAQFPYFLLVLIRHLLLWCFACTNQALR